MAGDRMTWNIAPEVVSLIFLLIIWTYSRKGSHLPSFKNRTFQLCLVITFIAIGSNILSTFMIYYLHSGLRWMTWAIRSDIANDDKRYPGITNFRKTESRQ